MPITLVPHPTPDEAIAKLAALEQECQVMREIIDRAMVVTVAALQVLTAHGLAPDCRSETHWAGSAEQAGALAALHLAIRDFLSQGGEEDRAALSAPERAN